MSLSQIFFWAEDASPLQRLHEVSFMLLILQFGLLSTKLAVPADHAHDGVPPFLFDPLFLFVGLQNPLSVLLELGVKAKSLLYSCLVWETCFVINVETLKS